MGDMSKEPSMEEILSSIKRIIAEEGDEAVRGATSRAPRRGRPAEAEADEEIGGVIRDAQVDEVLELTDAFDHEPKPLTAPEPVSSSTEAQDMTPPAPAAALEDQPEVSTATPADSMLSVESEVATRHSLSNLSALLVKPQSGEGNTLEALVRELLRPMMKQWLDANLPDLVEAMVAKEIARITSREL